jgi:preprotein translocase subunit SecA
LIQDNSAEQLVAQITQHLLDAQQATTERWGLHLWQQLTPQTQVKDIPSSIFDIAVQYADWQTADVTKEAPTSSLSENQKRALVYALGFEELNESYRGLILRVISELWVEYLTKMEALRVSIGLEAYGQRDPLVVYKTRASQMFQELFEDMRMSVVTRMFKSRPRVSIKTVEQLSVSNNEEQAKSAQEDGIKERTSEAQTDSQPQEKKSKKRRRRRRR